MVNDSKPHESFEKRVEEATGWLNDKLSPYIGAAQLGPFDVDIAEPVAERSCPICGFAMGEHGIEIADDGRTFLYHPDDRFHEVMETGHHV